MLPTGKMALPNPSMDWSNPDRSQAFCEFKQIADMWFQIKEIKPENQHNYILLWAGKEGLRMYNTWGLTEEQLKDPANIWNKFAGQMERKENFRMHRLEFQRYKQEATESVDDFLTRCTAKALKCQNKDEEAREERIIEVLIGGIKYPEVQRKLLSRDQGLTLREAADICRTHEASMDHMAQLSSMGHSFANTNIDAITARGKSTQCRYCGTAHSFRKKEFCPAYGTTCKTCRKMNHWRVMCRAESKEQSEQHVEYNQHSAAYRQGARRKPHYRQGGPTSRRVHTVTEDTQDALADQFDMLAFEAVSKSTSVSESRDEVFATLNIKLENRVGAHTLKVKVDTGAQGNILPLRVYSQMCPEKLDGEGHPEDGATTPSNTILTAYNGTCIPQYGTVTLKTQYGESEWTNTKFYVAEAQGPAIMGLPSLQALKLLSLHCAVTKQENKSITDKIQLQAIYPDRFEGIGKFPGEFKITLQEDAQPVVQAPRKYPIQIKEEIRGELGRMETLGVIKKVTDPTDWVSSIAFSRKSNGKLRICIDPKDLNRAMKRTYHKTPTLEEITHNFAGATVFSKVDARHGYWSIALDEESSHLTTFNSPVGRYRFLRLPFGLKVSQDIFQEKMDLVLEKCPGTLGIADDIAVYGKTEMEHDENLHKLMEVAREYGVVFNIEKCEIKVPTIKFFGCLYDKEGIHPDPEKIQALQSLPAPQNCNEVQQFLGLAQYMAPFIPKLADNTETLRALTRKDTEWQWTPSHQASFESVKASISSECILTFFNPKKKTTIQVDASQKGLGAALIQDGKPVAFASKALTETEKRYANIERELLAVVFGCTRFHTYIYGAQFTVESDHKPLENIQHKSLANTPPRLQRMMLKIQPYDFIIKYRPGREMVMADMMSRFKPEPGKQIDMDSTIYAVTFTPPKLNDMKEATNADPQLHSF